jgi:hypothetical protein
MFSGSLVARRGSILLYPKVRSSLSPKALCSGVSDRDLQLKANSVSHKLNVLFDVSVGSDTKNYIAMFQDGILPKNFLASLMVYVDLKNPLLQKYNIRYKDMVAGSKHAFDVVYKAIAAPDLAMKATGQLETSEAYDLLKDTTNTTLFNCFTDAAKQLHSRGIRSKLVELEIVNATLRGVKTRIVPGDVPSELVLMTDDERKSYLENAKLVKETLGVDILDSETRRWRDKLNPPTTDEKADQAIIDSTRDTGSSATDSPPSGNNISTSTSTPQSAATQVASPSAAPATPTAPATPAIPAIPAATPASVPANAPGPATVTAPAPAPTATTPASASNNEADGTRHAPATRGRRGAASAHPDMNWKTTFVTADIDPVQTPDITAAASATNEEHNDAPAAGTTTADSSSTEPPVVKVRRANEKFLSAYPPGSVVASVTVQYDIREEYETSLRPQPAGMAATEGTGRTAEDVASAGLEERAETEDAGPQTTVRTARKNRVTWTYRGCISGQVPLQWRLVAFNGMTDPTSKY